MNVEMLPFQEMESLVSGLDFLHCADPQGEVFCVDADGTQVVTPWPADLYPCLLVNMGSLRWELMASKTSVFLNLDSLILLTVHNIEWN